MVERLHLELQGMFRTIRSRLEEQYRMRIPTHHPSELTMALQTCLVVERQIPYRSEGSEDGLSKAAPKI
eukprot:1999897-Amphidinium_carterae.1